MPGLTPHMRTMQVGEAGRWGEVPCLCKLDCIVHADSDERPANDVWQSSIGHLTHDWAAGISKHWLNVPPLVIKNPILCHKVKFSLMFA